MAGTVAERIQRYVMDGSDQDLRRLLGISQVSEPMVRGALRRVGVREGWAAIDCGCGPLGALSVLADAVGPSGRVVGVDMNPAAVERARAVASALDLGNVHVVARDLHDVDAAALGGQFDLAYTRLFLMHQHDPVRTLRHISDLLRPGAYLVAQEPLPRPTPRSHPPLDALADYWDVVGEAVGRAGVSRDVVANLEQSAREAGLEVADADGYFGTLDASVGFELHAATLTAIRERATGLGISGEHIDGLIRRFQSARNDGYQWVSSPFYRDLTFRKPAA